MGRRKIVFLAESLNIGGAEKALISILKFLDYSKLDVTLKLISKSGDFVKDLDGIDGLKIDYIVSKTANPIIRLFNAIKIKAIYQWLPSFVSGNYLCRGYDIAVAFCEGYLTKWVGASSVPCKKIAWVHTDMVLNDWPLNTGVYKSQDEEIQAYKRFDDIVAVSKITASGMEVKFGCDTPTVIYNLLDADIIPKSKEPVHPVRKASLNLVSIGRLEYVKGYDMLVEAMNTLVYERKLDINLCLVGDGTERQKLEGMINSFNLQDNITLTGFQSNPYPYIAAADLFVCPSRQEGFNIAILEAMTLGKPIIATKAAGPVEILDSGRYGIVVDISPDGITEAIEKCFRDSELLATYSSLSLERSKDFAPQFSIKSIMDLIGK